MSMLPALRKLLLLAVVVASAALLLAGGDATAQQQTGGTGATQAPGGGYVVRERGVGGYSLTLRDVWGPAKMPPAPTDFGPHFDFPPEPLGGGLTHDPYPN
jgi:hypothetical protein